MTLQLLHSEFPYIWGKFDFLFYQCDLEFVYIEESGRYGWKNFESHFVNLQECNPPLSWFREFSKAYLMTFFNNLRSEGSSHGMLQNGAAPHLLHCGLPVLWIRTRIPLSKIRIRVPNPCSRKAKKNVGTWVLWRAIPTAWSLLLGLKRSS